MNTKLYLLSVALSTIPLTIHAAPPVPRDAASSASVAIAAPVLATVEQYTVARREPIRLHFAVRNTFAGTFYIGYTSLLSDWGFSVNWLGADGHSSAQAVPKTAIGKETLAPPQTLSMCINKEVPPGAALEGPVVVINRLFDMRRPGVYTIWVNRRMSPDGRWRIRKMLISPAVQVRVR